MGQVRWKSEYLRQGNLAFRLGDTEASNPYPAHTVAEREWWEGWRLAKSDQGRAPFWELDEPATAYDVALDRLHHLAAIGVLNAHRIWEESQRELANGKGVTGKYQRDRAYFINA